MSELFSEKVWYGEFYSPGHYEDRFSGKIKYSLESGLTLEYIYSDVKKRGKEYKFLYGSLDNRKKCTLFNSHGHTLGLDTGSGLFTAITSVEYLLIGDHIKDDSLFKKVGFSLINIQEFFFLEGFKTTLKFERNPYPKLKTKYGELYIYHKAKFTLLGEDEISSVIHSNNSEVSSPRKAVHLLSYKFSYIFSNELI